LGTVVDPGSWLLHRQLSKRQSTMRLWMAL
jgi:hypothetical protein